MRVQKKVVVSGSPGTFDTKEQARIAALEKMVRELIDVFVPTIRSEMNLTQGQSGTMIRAKALLREQKQ